MGLFLLVMSLSILATAQAQNTGSGRQFLVFDGLVFTEKPNLAQFGLKPINIIAESAMWPPTKPSERTNLPDRNRINALAKQAYQSSGIAVIDIEAWPLTGNPVLVADSVKKYQTTIQWFKTSEPPLKVGYYGVAPVRNYWDALQGPSSWRYATWRMTNDTVAPVAQFSDILFPSLYTFYEDRDGWVRYATAQIQEARRLAGGKPVYVFLWPEYHSSDKKLANTFLPGDYWRTELETARKYADGAVIWCCPTKTVWDGNAAWWLETQKFMKETGK